MDVDKNIKNNIATRPTSCQPTRKILTNQSSNPNLHNNIQNIQNIQNIHKTPLKNERKLMENKNNSTPNIVNSSTKKYNQQLSLNSRTNDKLNEKNQLPDSKKIFHIPRGNSGKNTCIPTYCKTDENESKIDYRNTPSYINTEINSNNNDNKNSSYLNNNTLGNNYNYSNNNRYNYNSSLKQEESTKINTPSKLNNQLQNKVYPSGLGSLHKINNQQKIMTNNNYSNMITNSNICNSNNVKNKLPIDNNQTKMISNSIIKSSQEIDKSNSITKPPSYNQISKNIYNQVPNTSNVSNVNINENSYINSLHTNINEERTLSPPKPTLPTKVIENIAYDAILIPNPKIKGTNIKNAKCYINPSTSIEEIQTKIENSMSNINGIINNIPRSIQPNTNITNITNLAHNKLSNNNSLINIKRNNLSTNETQIPITPKATKNDKNESDEKKILTRPIRIHLMEQSGKSNVANNISGGKIRNEQSPSSYLRIQQNKINYIENQYSYLKPQNISSDYVNANKC